MCSHIRMNVRCMTYCYMRFLNEIEDNVFIGSIKIAARSFLADMN